MKQQGREREREWGWGGWYALVLGSNCRECHNVAYAQLIHFKWFCFYPIHPPHISALFTAHWPRHCITLLLMQSAIHCFLLRSSHRKCILHVVFGSCWLFFLILQWLRWGIAGSDENQSCQTELVDAGCRLQTSSSSMHLVVGRKQLVFQTKELHNVCGIKVQ